MEVKQMQWRISHLMCGKARITPTTVQYRYVYHRAHAQSVIALMCWLEKP
jgi:hypothetical protein